MPTKPINHVYEKIKLLNFCCSSHCWVFHALCPAGKGGRTDDEHQLSHRLRPNDGARRHLRHRRSIQQPAGLAWGHEGWQLSFNWQMPSQDRDITTTFPMFTSANHTTKFHGEASAPFVPGLFAAYHHGKWAVSTMIGIVGSGGYVKYNDGLPMFNAPLMATFYAKYQLTPDKYNHRIERKGQAIHLWRTGVRDLSDQRPLGCIGWPARQLLRRILPRICEGHHEQRGQNFGGLSDRLWPDGLGIQSHPGRGLSQPQSHVGRKIRVPCQAEHPQQDQYQHRAIATGRCVQRRGETRYDMPSLLTFAAGYEFTPSCAPHWNIISSTTSTPKWQTTDRRNWPTARTNSLQVRNMTSTRRSPWARAASAPTGPTGDGYETNTSFACDSYSVGRAAPSTWTPICAWTWVISSPCTATTPSTPQLATPGGCSTTMEGTDVYSRTNGVFGIGVDYKF